jgi:hypothetical protein
MPETTITGATEDQLAQFDSRVIAHPILDSVFKNLKTVTRHPGGIPLVVVDGPTGVGKSTLVDRLYRDIVKDSAAAMQTNPGLIPVILVEAPSPDSGSFHWGDFYVRFLEAAFEPMIQQKALHVFDREDRERRKKLGTFAALRRAVEQCIRHRGTTIVIIDEAQHLTKVHNARRLQDQMDTIKSLASLSGVQFIMVGTTELLTLLNQNGQLARRTRCIHFPRYRFDDAADRKCFRNILGMFESRLPIQGPSVLVENSEYVYEHCLGCVGTLKDWLKLATRHAVEAGKSSLELSDLEATALSNDSLIQMLQETLEGERRIESSKLRGDELRTKLGLQKPPSPTAQVEVGKAVSPRRVVGERKLIRDPVGVAP